MGPELTNFHASSQESFRFYGAGQKTEPELTNFCASYLRKFQVHSMVHGNCKIAHYNSLNKITEQKRFLSS